MQEEMMAWRGSVSDGEWGFEVLILQLWICWRVVVVRCVLLLSLVCIAMPRSSISPGFRFDWSRSNDGEHFLVLPACSAVAFDDWGW